MLCLLVLLLVLAPVCRAVDLGTLFARGSVSVCRAVALGTLGELTPAHRGQEPAAGRPGHTTYKVGDVAS